MTALYEMIPSVGRAVPGSEDAIGLFGAAFVSQGDDGADGDLGRIGVFEAGSTGAGKVAFGLRAAPHEDTLLFLGGLELEVFAQIAVGAGRGDVLGILRDLTVDQVLELLLALFEAGP